MRLIALLSTLLLLGGCLKSVELNQSGKFACTSDDDCLNGMTCHLNEFGEHKCFIVSQTPDTTVQKDTLVPDKSNVCELVAPPPENACSGSADQGAISGFTSVNQEVVSCIAKTGDPDATVVACNCFIPDHKLSKRCATCFGHFSQCLHEKCNDSCNPLKGGKPTGTPCTQCLANNGCQEPFNKCSGLP